MQLTAKFSFVSLLASLLSASALKLNVPVPVPGDVELQTNGKALVTWTLEEGDPEIMSINIQNNFRFFAFVNNVPTAPGNVTGVLTDIPGG
ncbi:hypothetical protein BDQ17DRAFT_1421748 [Cyathus striatus]|nr:hypothetical protein BDQ17DRAFT_1421748 [Cyathus striatus]